MKQILGETEIEMIKNTIDTINIKYNARIVVNSVILILDYN